MSPLILKIFTNIKPALVLTLLCASIQSGFSETEPLRVGIYDNPPKVFLNKQGEASGIFVDIINYIAEREGWNIEYVYGSWDSCLKYLNNGTIDLMTDVAYSEIRDTIYDFNRITVLPSWIQFYTRKGTTLLSYRELEGKRIAVLDGSIQERLCREIVADMGISVEYITYANYSDSIDAVLFNQADALIASRFLGFSDVSRYLESSPLILSTSTLHFAALDGQHTEILDRIDTYLIPLFNNPRSEYYRSLERWFHSEQRYYVPLWVKLLLLVISLSSLIGITGALVFRNKLHKKAAALIAAGEQIAHTNKELKTSLQEKELLLKELYHRMGNNMNLIISLLSLKADMYDDPGISAYRKDIESRIYPLMLVHTMAYESDSLSHIHLHEYMSSLTGKIISLFPESGNRIRILHTIPDNIVLPVDTVIPLGVIITELLTNSFQYAFPGKQTGSISLSAALTNDRTLSLTCSDSGVGLPSDIDWRNNATLGFQLINEIIHNQLQGQINKLPGDGTSFLLTFPLRPTSPRI